MVERKKEVKEVDLDSKKTAKKINFKSSFKNFKEN